jgi:3-dehydroquinate synthase
MKEFHQKEYSVYLGNEVFDTLLQELINRSYSQVFVLADQHTQKYCLPLLDKYLLNKYELICIASGESNKTLQTAQYIWEKFYQSEADKKSVLINLGGGVVSDIGGFCATLFKRGIDYVNVPTTLLAMVDAAIGGKTAIDFEGAKNMIGVIRHPRSIFIYPDFLATLPKEEMLNGYAEMIKHGLIADKDYWLALHEAPIEEWPKMVSHIHTSVKLKLSIVKKDPYENGLRKLLNFGHTIGHAIEAYSLANDSKPLKHGEAVAIGMICEAYLSKIALGFSNKDLRHITEMISRIYPKYSLRSVLSPELIKYMRQDKKNANDQINFSLLKKIGKSVFDISCTDNEITTALNFYDSL